MHGWMAVGTSPTVMRIPSVVAMVAAVAMTAILAMRLTGSGWAGLFAGLVMALTPGISYYAQTARSYALVAACAVGATLVLVHALEREAAGAAGARAARRWVAYAALVTVGGYLNEMSLLVLGAHAVTVLLARPGRRVVRHWAAAGAAGAVLVLPLLVVSVREHGAVSWIHRPGLADLRILFQDYFGATAAAAALVFVCAIVAVQPGAWGGAPECAWWRRSGVSLPSVAAPLLVVPAGLLLGESLVAPPLYVDRYVLYGEAGAALLAGAGLYRIGRWLASPAGRRPIASRAGRRPIASPAGRRSIASPADRRSIARPRRTLLWAPGVIVCICALLLQLGPQHRVRTPHSRSFDFGSACQYVGARARSGDGVLFFPDFYRKARLGYPGDFAKIRDFAMAVSPQQAGTFRGSDKPFRITGPLMLSYRRIWVIGRVPSPRLKSPALRAESIALKSHFSLLSKRRFRGMVVTLWLRR
jgi:mannosyltransferase